MKKTIAGILSAFICFACFCSAYADEKSAFSIVREHLLADLAGTSMLSRERISAMISDLAGNGYAVSDSEYGETEYPYDVALDILESILGDYYAWTVEEKHEFDQIMVECGELPYCHNLLPEEGEISQEEAQRLALMEIAGRFGVDQALLERASAISVSYYITNRSTCGGMWRFGIDLENQMRFEVEVTEGSVTRCQESPVIDDLEKEYGLLCDQRGAFFQWSLQEKMEFADSLPQKLARAKKQDTLLISDLELEAIAAYGFCLPTAGALSQEEATAAAASAMKEKLGITGEGCTQIYYSFFYQRDLGYVWRVIFWNTGDAAYTSVIVDMQALTGNILSVKANGHTASEYIPYTERL